MSIDRDLKVACFRLGPLDCAVDVMAVAEILPPRPVHPVPGAPPIVEGLVDVRGRFLPAIDLRRRLGLVVGPVGRTIVALLGETRLALLCDDVTAVEVVPRGAIRPPPELGAAPLAPAYLIGVAPWRDTILYLLDLDALFSADELRAVAAAKV